MQPTNFFTTLLPLLEGTTKITLVALKNTDGTISVSVHPKNDAVKDSAVSLIPPVVLTATADELDAEFFTTIQKPIETVKGFFSDALDYEKKMEEVRKQSDMEKKQKEEKIKAVIEAKKLMDENSKKVKQSLEELTQKSPEEGLKEIDILKKKFPLVSDSVKEEIEKLENELKTKTSTPSLFN